MFPFIYSIHHTFVAQKSVRIYAHCVCHVFFFFLCSIRFLAVNSLLLFSRQKTYKHNFHSAIINFGHSFRVVEYIGPTSTIHWFNHYTFHLLPVLALLVPFISISTHFSKSFHTPHITNLWLPSNHPQYNIYITIKCLPRKKKKRRLKRTPFLLLFFSSRM